MKNTLYTNDNLFILYGLNSESVDLIYLDPPFNSKRTYSAPIGSKAAGTSFKDMWNWQDVNEAYLDKLVEKYPSLVRFIQSIQEIHSKGMMAYITYITQRVIEMHRILKTTGSFYLHCDPTASHYLKVVLDEIFGRENFRNEIVWCYTGPGKALKQFKRKHDIILFYSKSSELLFYNDAVKLKHKSGLHNKGTLHKKMDFTEEGNRQMRARELLGKDCEDWWQDIGAGAHISIKERTGYPTQKPLALMERIIKASSKEGDIVLDPFCGCATTCVAAQRLNRKWIGIDIEKQAVKVLIDRLSDYDELKAAGSLFSDFTHRTDIPQRTDIEIEPITQSVKEKLFKEQCGHCNACSVEMRIVDFEIDHIVPKSKGGGDYYENYQLLCGSCNKIKGDRPMEYLRIKIKQREELLKNKLTFGE